MASGNVVRYLIGNSISNTGTWVYNLAASILVFRLTGSALLVGAVSSAQFAGTILLAPWAGSAADRFDRRRLLTSLQTGGALVSGALAVMNATGNATAGVVIASSALLGFALAFTTPALHALIPLLVPERDTDLAVALNSLTFNLARALGPLIGAAVIASLGLSAAFAFNGVSFLVFVVAVSTLRPRSQQAAPPTSRMFRDSLDYVWHSKEARYVLLTVSSLSISMDPVSTLAPSFAVDVFGRGDEFAGILIGAFGIGATATALTAMSRLRRFSRSLEVSMISLGVGMVAYAMAPHEAVALIALAVAGGGYLVSVSQATARLHAIVPPERLGRAMALWGVAFLGSRPVAALADGAIADAWQVRPTTALFALPAFAMAAAWLWPGSPTRPPVR